MNQQPEYQDFQNRIPGRNRRYDRFRHRNSNRNHAGFGLVILIVGAAILLSKLNIFPYLSFHDLWPVILIIIGISIGVRKRFTNNAWWILILIGGLNLIPQFEIMGHSSRSLAVPVALIIGGLILIMRPRKKNNYMQQVETITTDSQDVNVDVTFGGRKEIITSKEFRGGSICATFAGAELNLMQADSSVQPMVLHLQVTFAGVELVVPSHWELQNEIEPTFGSVEDHRMMRTASETENRKVLILKGSCSFGSVEIKSY